MCSGYKVPEKMHATLVFLWGVSQSAVFIALFPGLQPRGLYDCTCLHSKTTLVSDNTLNNSELEMYSANNVLTDLSAQQMIIAGLSSLTR